MRCTWILGVIAVILAVSPWCVVADSNQTGASDTPPSWSGVWESLLYQETFVQDGTTVTGTYIPISSAMKNDGIIVGAIADDPSVLSGTWKEIGDVKLTFSDDTSAMIARWAYNDEDRHFSKIYGEDPIEGIWTSESLTLSLFKEGSMVQGSYYSLDATTGVCGLMNGTLSQDGSEITGTYIESGNFSYTLADDGSSFNGTYTYGAVPQKAADTWNATRLS
jgi:hypothetical protein